MKKILFVLVLGAVIFFGGTYYISSEAQNSFERGLGNLETINGINVQNEVYEKGLFKSKISFDIGYNDPVLNIDIKAKAKGEIDNSIITALSSTPNAKFEFIAINASDEFKELFGSDVFMTSTIKKNISGNHEIKANLKDINIKKDELGILNSNGIGFSMNTDKNHFVSNANFNIGRISLDSDEVVFNISDLVVDVDMTEKTSISDFFIKILPAKSIMKSKEFSLSMSGSSLLFSGLEYSGEMKLDKNTGLLNGNDSTNIAKVVVNDAQFKDIVLQSDIKNLNADAVNKILEIASSQHNMEELALSDEASKSIEKAITDVLKSNPAINLKLDMKSEDKATLSSYLNFALNGFNTAFNQETFVFDALESLSLDGSIKITPSLGEFLPVISEIKEMEKMFLEQGFLVKDGNSVKSDIKFDKESKDILINNKISLMQLMLFGMF